MAQKQVYDLLTPDVALEFFRLKYPEEKIRGHTTTASKKSLAAAPPEVVKVGAGNDLACWPGSQNRQRSINWKGGCTDAILIEGKAH